MLLLLDYLEDKLDYLAAEKQLDFSKTVVAVSGGADSLALAVLMAKLSKEKGFDLVALTVNHNLRPTSEQEAGYVAEVMQKFGVKHYILEWKHEHLLTAVEEKARQARYTLLIDWCIENGFSNLMTAHHQQDQAETFLMRLQRGSGVDGLSGIAEVSRLRGIHLVRPLLDVDQAHLQAFLQEEGLEWVEDESNHCDDYLRVRVRKALPLLEAKLGISVRRIANTTKAMSSVREFLEEQRQDFVAKNVEFFGTAVAAFKLENFSLLHREMQVRVLAYLIKNISQKDYPPTFEELDNLKKRVLEFGFKASSLGGCEIVSMGKKLWIVKKVPESFVYYKKIWQVFCEQNPKYEKIVLPYRAKINLLVEFGR